MGRLLQHRFEDAAQQAPERLAFLEEGRRLSYGRLDELSNRIAHTLRAHGCRPGDRVAVCSTTPADTLAEQIGVLKAGGVYVPDEPDGRAVQRARLLRDCRPRVVLFSGCAPDVLDDLRVRGAMNGAAIGWLGANDSDVSSHFSSADLEGAPTGSASADADDESLAVILYQAGRRSNEPVGLTHGEVDAAARWAAEYFGLGPADRVSAHHPPVSGIALMHAWAALSAGAQLHRVPAWLRRVPHEIPRFVRDRGLTVWSSAASHLEYVVRFGALERDALPTLRHVAWSGPGLPAAALHEWRKRVPTATFTRFYAPDADGVPVGGEDVSPHFNDASRAAAPFGGRLDELEATSDRRDLPDGLSEVDAARVEDAIRELDGVAACALIPVPPRDPSPNRIACAYVTWNGRPLREAEVRRRLGERLPPNAIPSRWLSLHELPVDRWGRIDRARASALLGG